MILKEINQVIDKNSGVVTIVTGNEVSDLTIDGSDVDGLPNDYVIAPGSVIIAPNNEYLCYEVSDGKSTFAEREVKVWQSTE